MKKRIHLTFALDAADSRVKWFERKARKMGHGGKTQQFLLLCESAMLQEQGFYTNLNKKELAKSE